MPRRRFLIHGEIFAGGENRTPSSIIFGDFVVTFRCNSSEFPGFFIRKSLTYKYLVRLEGIEPS